MPFDPDNPDKFDVPFLESNIDRQSRLEDDFPGHLKDFESNFEGSLDQDDFSSFEDDDDFFEFDW